MNQSTKVAATNRAALACVNGVPVVAAALSAAMGALADAQETLYVSLEPFHAAASALAHASGERDERETEEQEKQQQQQQQLQQQSLVLANPEKNGRASPLGIAEALAAAAAAAEAAAAAVSAAVVAKAEADRVRQEVLGALDSASARVAAVAEVCAVLYNATARATLSTTLRAAEAQIAACRQEHLLAAADWDQMALQQQLHNHHQQQHQQHRMARDKEGQPLLLECDASSGADESLSTTDTSGNSISMSVSMSMSIDVSVNVSIGASLHRRGKNKSPRRNKASRGARGQVRSSKAAQGLLRFRSILHRRRDVVTRLRSHGKPSKNDEDENDMEDEQSIETLRECFESFDTDGSGELSACELVAAMERMGEGGVTVPEAERMIAACDKDGNGFLSLAEFVYMMTCQRCIGPAEAQDDEGRDGKKKRRQNRKKKAPNGRSGPLERAVDAVAARMSSVDLEKMRGAFEAVDLDESGDIDAGELLKALSSMGLDEKISNKGDGGGSDGATYDTAKQMIAGVDEDGDGRLNFSEFVYLMSQKDGSSGSGSSDSGGKNKNKNASLRQSLALAKARVSKLEALRSDFNRLDHNQSGAIDAHELSHAMSQMIVDRNDAIWETEEEAEAGGGGGGGGVAQNAVTVAEAKDIIAQMTLHHGRGGDGGGEKLTFDDFVKMMECFNSYAHHASMKMLEPSPPSTIVSGEGGGSGASLAGIGSGGGGVVVTAEENAREEHLEMAFNLVRAAEFMGERYLEDKLNMDAAREKHWAKLEEVSR